MTPHQRFRPAVGGGGAAAELDPQVHWIVCEMAQGVEFTLNTLISLREACGQERWFVAAQNFDAVTCLHGVLTREPKAIVPSWKGGMVLGRQTPGHGRAVREPHRRLHFC